MSVVVLTYNHERFITQALTSVLTQQQAPPHEVLVAEDCSTDRTRAVLEELARQWAGRFRILPRERNLGLSANLEDAFRACRGRYIAILEADDYWCDPLKLAKVTTALESHPEWCGCFHYVRAEDKLHRQAAEIWPKSLPREEPIVALTDLLAENYVPSYSAVVYRAGLVREFPAWHRRIACGDWGLHVLHAEHGPFGCLPEIMTVYRIHAGGMWSSMEDARRWQQIFSLWSALDLHFQGRYAAEIEAARNAYIEKGVKILTDLRRIERRYHRLQLDHIASVFKWFKDRWKPARSQ